MINLDDSQLVTLRLESGNCLRFQPDTGAQCNVILELYKKATKDTDLKNVSASKTKISAYGGTGIPVMGQVIVPVWRDGKKFKLDCKVADNTSIGPVLGRKACLVMKILQNMDIDEINKPDTGNAHVYAMNTLPNNSRNDPSKTRQIKHLLLFLFHISPNQIIITSLFPWIPVISLRSSSQHITPCSDHFHIHHP